MAGTTATVAAMLLLMCNMFFGVLTGTDMAHKNPLFDHYFTSLDSVQAAAQTTGMTFAPGLYELLVGPNLPTVDFFKTLPTNEDFLKDIWSCYLLVLYKPGRRFRVYIGSATSFEQGARQRMQQYDNFLLLPRYVAASLDAGFVIIHKGMLCWIPRPIFILVPLYRLFIIGFEAVFSYVFWAFKRRGRDFGLSHICPWDRHSLEYNGLCSHSALDEGIRGDFDLTQEELEALGETREAKRIKLKAENATNWHHKQMETNYSDYMDASVRRVQKSRKLNPKMHADTQRARIKRDIAAKKYWCDDCSIAFQSKQVYDDHMVSDKHERMLNKHLSPFFCGLCNMPSANKSNFTRHCKTNGHQEKLKAAAEAAEQAEDEDDDDSFNQAE
ncbi:hypothetical protein CB0940_03846 [Cercospora beticola]|uniref:C2H2-type domain-containing protein n=1 Tax=Cercospora beticola TaxID=122368 RepID=A0A2G5HMD3_CERBT|nr:hypothetical protein CB0940_03846 [Cercospora beticola]PIA93668.1 hypothetical protein CB0940_03846 [Cercospora beticola]WPB01045.1 hypothetical protein RHO25_005665 [Cercospora beticola]